MRVKWRHQRIPETVASSVRRASSLPVRDCCDVRSSFQLFSISNKRLTSPCNAVFCLCATLFCCTAASAACVISSWSCWFFCCNNCSFCSNEFAASVRFWISACRFVRSALEKENDNSRERGLSMRENEDSPCAGTSAGPETNLLVVQLLGGRTAEGLTGRPLALVV